jgi:hypothetical protein
MYIVLKFYLTILDAEVIFTIIFEFVRHQKCLMSKIVDILTIQSY